MSLGKQWKMDQVLGALCLCGRPWWSSWLSPGHCNHLRSEPANGKVFLLLCQSSQLLNAFPPSHPERKNGTMLVWSKNCLPWKTYTGNPLIKPSDNPLIEDFWIYTVSTHWSLGDTEVVTECYSKNWGIWGEHLIQCLRHHLRYPYIILKCWIPVLLLLPTDAPLRRHQGVV